MPRQYIYHKTNQPGHPLATACGLVLTHRLVLYEKIGPGPHPCHWCGTVLEWRPGAGARPGALCVDHVDRDIRNNAPENLVPACCACNTRRGAEYMRGARPQTQGERNYAAKLTALVVGELRRRYANGGVSQRALAKEYGVSHTLVGYIIRGVAWKHIRPL